MTVSFWNALKVVTNGGRSVLTSVLDWADENGHTLSITVEEDFDSRDALAKVYAGHGFTIVEPHNVLVRKPKSYQGR